MWQPTCNTLLTALPSTYYYTNNIEPHNHPQTSLSECKTCALPTCTSSPLFYAYNQTPNMLLSICCHNLFPVGSSPPAISLNMARQPSLLALSHMSRHWIMGIASIKRWLWAWYILQRKPMKQDRHRQYLWEYFSHAIK